MSTELRLPSLGAGMSDGLLTEWHVADGAQVDAGTVIYSVESEKTTMEIEAPVAGTLRILAAADQEYPVGELVGRIE